MLPEITNNDPNIFRRRRRATGIFGLFPFVALSALQVVLFFVTHQWLYLIGLPITAFGLTLAVRSWNRPKMLLLGAIVAFIGDVLPFFLTD